MRTSLLILALGIGLVIAFVDSRPGWDDTGISAAAVFMSGGLLGALSPRSPWIWALAVGIWIPLYAVLISQNYGTIAALVVAFAGAYLGSLFRFARLAAV